MKKFVILLITVFSLNFVFGQYEVRHYTVESGLKSTEINTQFLETTDGYIWFFCDGYLTKFDGNNFEYYRYNIDKSAFTNYKGGNLVMYNGAIMFEYNYYIYLFKHGIFKQLNTIPLNNKEESYGGTINIDKHGQFLYGGNLYQITDENTLKIDTTNTLDLDTDSFKFTETEDFISYGGLKSTRILANDQIDTFELGLYTPAISVYYEPFSINSNKIIYYSPFGDTTYLIKNNKISTSYYMPSPIDPTTYDGFGMGVYDPVFFRKNDSFSFFGKDYFLNNDTIIYWNTNNTYLPILAVSENEILFRGPNGLFVKNFIENTTFIIDKVDPNSIIQAKVLRNGKLILLSKNGLYILTKSNIINTNHHSMIINYTQNSSQLFGQTVSPSGTFYGHTYLSESLERSYDRNKGIPTTIYPNGTVVFSNKKEFLSKIIETKNDNIYIYEVLDSIKNKFTHNIIIQGTDTSYLDHGFMYSYELINNSLYRYNSKSQEWHSIDIKNNIVSIDTSLITIGKFKEVLPNYLISINRNTHKKTLDSTQIKWQKLDGNFKCDSLTLVTNDYCQLYKLNNSELVVTIAGSYNYAYKLNLETQELTELILSSKIIEHPPYNSMWEKSGDTDKNEKLWIPTDEGFGCLNFSNDFSYSNYNIEKQIEGKPICVKIIKDSILLVLTNKAIYYQNLNSLQSTNNLKIEKIISLNGFFKIKQLVNDEIWIGNGNWTEVVKLPPNFLDIQFVNPPRLVLKSFQHDSIFEFGHYPEYRLVQSSDLKNKFDSGENNYVFEFSAQEFRNREYLSYRHKVIGLFDHWEYSTIPEVKLKSLTYGEYTLEFQSIYQNEFSEPFIYTFTILPPWYHTWWARTLYILVGFLIVFSFIRSRTAKLKKRQAELEQEIELATKEINEQKVEVEHQRDYAKNEHKKAEELRQVAEIQKEIVEERNKEILDSITYAKRIQNAILPPPRLVKEWLNDSFIFYKPKDIVAGDFYWMEVVKKDGKNIIFYAAADCTGHGVPGAMVSVVCSNALNRSIKEFNITDPALLLDKVTELVKDSFEQSEEAIKDGMDIAICALDLVDKKVWFSGANNPLYRITDLDNKVPENLRILEVDNRKLVEYKADKQPVGDYDHLKPFTTTEIQLEPGDCIYVFSDGFADQFGGEKNKKYKSANFKKFLMQIEGTDMADQKDILDNEIDRWRGEIEQLDDICVIGVRINGKMSKIFTKRELEIIKQIVLGKQSKEIAEELNIAKSTVDTHRKRILTKSNTHNATELINFCKVHEII